MDSTNAPTAKVTAAGIAGLIIGGILYAARLLDWDVTIIDPDQFPAELIAVIAALVAAYWRRETRPTGSVLDIAGADRAQAMRALAAWVVASEPAPGGKAEASGAALSARDRAVSLLSRNGGVDEWT